MAVLQNFSYQPMGSILLKKGLLTEKQVLTILKIQKNSKTLFGQIAVKLGFVKEDELLEILSEIYFIESVSLEFLYIDNDTLSSLDEEIAITSLVIPFYKNDTTVKIAMADPGDIKVIDKINSYFKGIKVEFFVAKESEILRFLEIIKNKSHVIEDDPFLYLNKIIFDALESRASDIHFEPYKNFINVRIRIDGELGNTATIALEPWNRVRSKLKIIAKLDIAESRKPQSGHARIYLAGKTVDLRISTHPGYFGENIAIRIFDLSNGIKPLNKLNFSKADLLWLKKSIAAPSGILLIVGPTGSGKTSTIYSLLQEIKSPSVNIMTLEDPIEYQIEGIKQLELKDNGLLSYSDGIRSILRQDPDVMLIGEIRDEETASMAVRAALTGRLVLATLHAYNPIDALRRLMNLQLSLDDFIPSLVGVFSQKLVRLIDNESDENSLSHKYHGRFPIAEYVSFTDDLKEKILTTQNIDCCKAHKTFKASARESIENNLTDLIEIKRILGDVNI